MKLSVRTLFVLLLCTVSLTGQSMPKTTRDWTYLNEKQHAFRTYHKDFKDFLKVVKTDQQFENVMDLVTIASENYERIDAANTILDIYENICAKDRIMIKPIFKERLGFNINLIDGDIEDLTSDISYATPAVSQTAIRMRDDLKEVRRRLETLRGSLD